MLRLSLLVLAIAAALPASAQVYQWRDAEGRVHYTDRPPPDADGRLIRRGASAPQVTTPPPAESMAEKEIAFRERQQAAAEAKATKDKERAEATERAKRCEQARRNLKLLDSGHALNQIKDDGSRREMKPSERAAERERTRAAVEKLCN